MLPSLYYSDFRISCDLDVWNALYGQIIYLFSFFTIIIILKKPLFAKLNFLQTTLNKTNSFHFYDFVKLTGLLDTRYCLIFWFVRNLELWILFKQQLFFSSILLPHMNVLCLKKLTQWTFNKWIIFFAENYIVAILFQKLLHLLRNFH